MRVTLPAVSFGLPTGSTYPWRNCHLRLFPGAACPKTTKQRYSQCGSAHTVIRRIKHDVVWHVHGLFGCLHYTSSLPAHCTQEFIHNIAEETSLHHFTDGCPSLLLMQLPGFHALVSCFAFIHQALAFQVFPSHLMTYLLQFVIRHLSPMVCYHPYGICLPVFPAHALPWCTQVECTS